MNEDLEMLDGVMREMIVLKERNAKLAAALDIIAAMDPLGKRADDLGRAARVAHTVLQQNRSKA